MALNHMKGLSDQGTTRAEKLKAR